jgi:hypothetical protein
MIGRVRYIIFRIRCMNAEAPRLSWAFWANEPARQAAGHMGAGNHGSKDEGMPLAQADSSCRD